MNSTTRFHSKPKPEAFASPFESRVTDSISPTTSTQPSSSSSTLRRSARRFARKPTLPISSTSDPTDPTSPPPETSHSHHPHPLEILVESLYSPPTDQEDQRTGEYEWYIHYPSDPASHALEMTDEKDLGVYVRQSRLASGEDVERTLNSVIGAGGEGGSNGIEQSVIGARLGVEEEEKRAGFYEGWLRAGV